MQSVEDAGATTYYAFTTWRVETDENVGATTHDAFAPTLLHLFFEGIETDESVGAPTSYVFAPTQLHIFEEFKLTKLWA